MSINLVISFNVRENSLASFTAVMNAVKTTLPAVSGCRTVKIFNDINNPLAFTLVEEWDSVEVHAKHVQGLKDSGQWALIEKQLATDPVSSYFVEI
jgi:quinol monooxygenase YgiN